jgi:site-specific DNA-methyltransferase (adenine-specific)
MQKLELDGQTFGRLTVLCEDGRSNAGKVQWICACECGTPEVIVIGSKLVNGHTTSCGCKQREAASKDGQEVRSFARPRRPQTNLYGKRIFGSTPAINQSQRSESMTTFTLHTGDCLDIMPAIPAGSVDMILCDLPYGTTSCWWDAVIPFDVLWTHYRRVLRRKGAAVLTAGQPFTTSLIASNVDWFKYTWIWKKPQGVDPFMSKVRPLNNIEDIVVFCEGRTKYNPQMTSAPPYQVTRDRRPRHLAITGTNMQPTTTVNSGTRYPTRILEFNQERGLHPTQKPVELMEYLIRTYTNEGETVLDNCMGSGTTGVACMNTGRNFIGIERDPKYFEIARSRIEAAQRAATRNETDWLACLDLPVIGQESASGLTIQ